MKMNPYNMPQIIKETSDGYFHLSVLDDLLSQREIYCLGEIDADSAGSLILQLQYLAAQDPEAEITLYINSPGGSVADGLALYDIMQTIPCPIRTVCMGRQIKNQCRETENSNRQSVMQFPAKLAPPASFTSTTQKCLSDSTETQLTHGSSDILTVQFIRKIN